MKEIILDILDIQSKAEGTLITSENSVATVVIADKGAPLGKYRGADIDINSKLKIVFNPIGNKIENTEKATIFDACSVTELKTTTSERGKVYTIGFTSNSTENDFFKLEVTVITNNKLFVEDIKYGSIFEIIGTFERGNNA